MKFLNKLKTAFLDYTSRDKIYKKQGDLTPKDGLYRFIYSKSHYASTKQLIKPSGLMPTNGELSTFLCDDLSMGEKLKLSKCKINKKPPKCIGSFKFKDVKSIQLGVCKKEWPHRHKNIIKWADAEEKSELKSQAQQLSSILGSFELVK